MKKLLIVNDFLVGGGVENVLSNLIEYLSKKDYDIFLLIPNCTQEDLAKTFNKKIKLYPPFPPLKPIKPKSLAWFIDRLKYVIRFFFYRIKMKLCNFDIVIALKEGGIMEHVSSFFIKNKYAWIHTDYQYMHWTRSCFKSNESEKKCMRKYKKVICVSNAVKNSVISTIGDPGNLCVKYNPINFRKIREKAKEDYPDIKKEDIPLFISIGRLAYPKNYLLLIEVCNKLNIKYNYRLWIIGDGSDRVELQKRINEYGLKNVKLIGGKNNPYPYLNNADAFVSTSLVESYGLALQEALVLGKPVIAIKCPAIVETVDCRFGFLVDNDFDSLYDAMEQYIINKEIRLKHENNIKSFYKFDEFYEKRLQLICDLWE